MVSILDDILIDIRSAREEPRSKMQQRYLYKAASALYDIAYSYHPELDIYISNNFGIGDAFKDVETNPVWDEIILRIFKAIPCVETYANKETYYQCKSIFIACSYRIKDYAIECDYEAYMQERDNPPIEEEEEEEDIIHKQGKEDLPW